MNKLLAVFAFCNIFLFLAVTGLSQSYSLANETTGLDTWNKTTVAVSGPLDSGGNPLPTGDKKSETTLPFSFEFFGKSYSSVFVSTNYFLSFVDVGVGEESFLTETNFRAWKIASPLWTSGSSQNVVYKNVYADRVVFTWDGQAVGTTQVQAVLYKNGDIRLRYGAVDVGTRPTIIGISAGDNTNYYHSTAENNGPTVYFKYVAPAAAAPSVAAAAKLAPQILNFTATPNATKRSQTVDFLFTIGDDLSVDSNAIAISLYPKEGNRTLIGRPSFRSGDEKTGVYNLTWKVPNNFTGGVYDVKLFVCDKAGNCDTAAQAGKVTINATVYFNLDETIKDSYNQTEIIRLSGETVDFLNKRVKANVTVDLLYPGGKYTFKNATEFGRYILNYRTSLLDALGNWTIDLKATDVDGNEGNLVKKIALKQPQAFFYYNLVFLSPINDSTYYRGESARVSVKVLDLDKVVDDANVSVKLPTGELISMSEVSPGTGIYQTNYRFKFGDKIGDWAIGVEGLKLTDAGLFAGSKSIKVNIRPVDLTIDIISPTKSRFAIGDSAAIRVRVSYPDNSAATGIFVNATPVKKSLALVETQSGVYEGSYKFTKGDKGRHPLRIFAIDSYDNLGFVEKSVFIVQPTILDLFVQLWYITIPGVVLVGYTVLHAKLPSMLRSYYLNRLKALEELKKSTQDKYFVEDVIDETTYKKLIQDTDRKTIEIRAKLKEQEKRLGKKSEKEQMFGVGDLVSSVKHQIESVTQKIKRKPVSKGTEKTEDKYEKEYVELIEKKSKPKKEVKKPPKVKQDTKDRAAILASLLKVKKK